MKKKFTFLTAAFMLLAFLAVPLGMRGQTYTQVTELDLTTKAYGTTLYNSNLDYISNDHTWNIVYGANNNKGWDYFKMGGKSATLSDYNPCYIYNKTAIAEQVDKVTVHLPAGSLPKAGMSVNSWGLYVYSNSAMTTQVDYVAGGTITNAEGSFDFTPSTGITWAANYYYKVSWDLANTTTTNGIVYVDRITLYKENTSVQTSNVAMASVDNVDLSATYSGGTLTEGNDADINQGDQVTLAYTNVTTGYIFSSWVITKQDDSSNVTAAVLSGSTLTVPAYDINISATVSQAQQYTITFEPGSGTCGTSSQTYYEGTVITDFPTATPSADCSEAGYTFDGWSATSVADGSSSYTKLTNYTVSGDATLYAVYNLTEGGAANTDNVFSHGSYNNSSITWSIDGVLSILQEQNGSGNSAPNSSYVNSPRWYSGNKITITQNKTLNSITVTANTEGYATALANSTYTNATASATGTTVTITPTNSNTITIIMGGQSRLSSLIVNYNNSTTTYATAPSCTPQVATPELSLSTGTYAGTQNVTISCATADAFIYYTLDGTDPTSASTLYEGAISISQTKTLKAIAIKSGYNDSDIAEATYTIVTPFTTMQQVYEDAVANTSEHEVYITFNNWVVTGTNGGNSPTQFFLTDASNTYGCVIYGSGSGFVLGNTLNGTVKCNLQYFGSNYQFAELTNLSTSTSGLTVGTGGDVTPAVTTIDALTSAKTGTVVTLNNLTYNGTVLTDGNNNINLSNYIYSATLTTGTKYNITGVFTLGSQSNNTYKRINPRSLSDITEVVDPTISATPTSMTSFTYVEGNGPSAAQTITVSGTNLEADITLALNDGDGSAFVLSTDQSNWLSSLTLAQTSGSVAQTTVYVRMKAGLSQQTEAYEDVISLTSTNASAVTVSLAGTVTGPQVTWDLSTASYDAGATANLVTWSSSYVTMTNAKGTSSTPANNALGGSSYDHTRFYKDQVLTITPASGYAITSIEINAVSGNVSGFTGNAWTNATASTSGTLVTVTPTNGNNACSVVFSAACRATSVTVFYEVSTLTPHAIAFDVDNGTVVATPTTAVAGATVTLKIFPDAGYYLATNSDIIVVDEDTDDVDLTNVNAGTFTFVMPDKDVTVYASFTAYTGTYYTLVSNAADLIPGRHYIIANSKEAGDAYVMAAYGSSYREAVATTVVGNIIYQTASVHEIVLSGDNTNFWTLYDDGTGNDASKGYLYAVSGNGLKNRTNYTSDNDGKWAISINNEGVASIVSQISGENVSNTIKFNNSTSPKRFSCYTPTSGQQSVYLYMKADETDYELYSNTTCNNLSIDYADIYTVHSPAVLNVTGSLYNGGDRENLIIEDGAQLKTPNAVFATVKKNITGYGADNFKTNKGYYLISAPADKYLYVANDNDDVDAYHFDAFHEGEEWQNFKLATGAWHIAAGNAVLYASKNDCTLSLDGYGIVYNTPNPGANIVYNKVPATNVDKSVDVALNSGKTFEGWNLIGNPYTCTAYLADGTQDFYRMNSTGDAIVLAASNERAIDVCEGIFVHCNATGTVTFTTTDPTVTSTGNNNGMVNISVAQVVNSRDAQPSADYARIRINNGENMSKFVFNENTSRVYIPQNGKDYAVVRSEAHGEMPVNFKAAETGTYTISVEAENLDVNYLHLIDNMTGMDVDLLATPSYTFEGKKSDYASRFKLVFSANADDTETETDEDFAFISDGNIIILNEGEATLQVIDIMGRVISTQTVNGNASVNNVGAAGVYVLQLINGNNVKTQKIVVR